MDDRENYEISVVHESVTVLSNISKIYYYRHIWQGLAVSKKSDHFRGRSAKRKWSGFLDTATNFNLILVKVYIAQLKTLKACHS